MAPDDENDEEDEDEDDDEDDEEKLGDRVEGLISYLNVLS